VARLAASPPGRCDGARALGAEVGDGVRLALADGGFVLWRASRTEPVVRIYAEASSAAALRRRLRAAQTLLERAEH
jgi:phosphomannomutase